MSIVGHVSLNASIVLLHLSTQRSHWSSTVICRIPDCNFEHVTLPASCQRNPGREGVITTCIDVEFDRVCVRHSGDAAQPIGPHHPDDTFAVRKSRLDQD